VAAEYGVGFALAFFGLLGWGLLRVIRRKDWRDQDRVLVGGLVMALAMVAVHNLLDFNVRVPAIGQVVGVMLGLLVAREARYRGVDTRRGVSSRRVERAQQAQDVKGDVGGEGQGEAAVVARLGWGGVWQRWGVVAVGGVVVVGVLGVGVGVLGRVERGVEGVDVVALKEVVGEVSLVGEEALMKQARGVVMDRPVDGYVSFLVGVGLAGVGEGAVRERALVWLDRARRLHRFDYRIELARGMVLGGMGRKAEAAAAFRAAAELDRGSVRAITLGVVKTFDGVDEVMESLSKSPLDWLQMGEVLLEAGRYGDVVEMAVRLQQEHPERVEGLVLAYRAAVGLGFSEAALGAARELVERFGDQPESYVRLYEAQLRQHPPDLNGAYGALLDGLKQHPKSMVLLQYQAHFLLGVGAKLFDEGDQSRWRQVVEEGMDAWRPGALANKQTRPAFYFLRGQYYNKINNNRQALQAYQAALAAQPAHVQSMVGVFEVSLRLGDMEQAAKSLKDLGEKLPKEALERFRGRLERCREVARKGGFVHEVEGKCEAGKTGDAMRQRLTEQRLLRQ
jgi:tetratricopeptide (TPR) repeat protein